MIKIRKLKNRKLTVSEIKRLSNKYFSDMLPLRHLNLKDFFDFLKNIPYHRDVYPVEVLRRPSLILELKEGDCKKKTILALSYAKINGIQNRIITISTRPSRIIHHIFPQFRIDGKWINFDATYKQYKIGQTKYITNCIIYKGI